MFATFASEPFAWQAAIVATLTAVALLIVIAVLTFGPSLVAWADQLLEEDAYDRASAPTDVPNVTPIDPRVEQQLLGDWNTVQPVGVLPLAETRHVELEVHW